MRVCGYTHQMEAITIIFWAAVIAALFFMSDDAKRGALLLSWVVMIIWTLAVVVRGLLS
jgi:hypothetical protein